VLVASGEVHGLLILLPDSERNLDARKKGKTHFFDEPYGL